MFKQVWQRIPDSMLCFLSRPGISLEYMHKHREFSRTIHAVQEQRGSYFELLLPLLRLLIKVRMAMCICDAFPVMRRQFILDCACSCSTHGCTIDRTPCH